MTESPFRCCLLRMLLMIQGCIIEAMDGREPGAFDYPHWKRGRFCVGFCMRHWATDKLSVSCFDLIGNIR